MEGLMLAESQVYEDNIVESDSIIAIQEIYKRDASLCLWFFVIERICYLVNHSCKTRA